MFHNKLTFNYKVDGKLEHFLKILSKNFIEELNCYILVSFKLDYNFILVIVFPFKGICTHGTEFSIDIWNFC